MYHIKTDEEIAVMRKSCKLAAEVLVMIEPYVKPGVTTNKLNQVCHDFILANGAIPSPLNYRGFPKSICTSVNEEICHGIPSDRKLRNGDIVNLDITTYLDEYHGDTSRTFFVGSPRKNASKLVETCKEALQKGLRRWLIFVPVLTPYLSSLWLALVTPASFEVGRHLIEGLKNPTVVRDRSALDVFPIRPMGIREAVSKALADD